MSFPKNFLWGGDISATQAEGGWNEGGKSPVEPDYYIGGDKNTMRYAYYKTEDGQIGKVMQYSGQLPEGAKYIFKEDEIYPNHFAADFYHHYQGDIALLGEMGFKALNLTISWARILPQGIKGGVNQEGVEFYRNVFLELKKYNIEPIVTMYKYDMPAFYVEEMGGWSNRQLIDEYVEFCKVCMTEYQGLVKYWITFNELNVLKVMLKINPFVTKDGYQRVYEELHHQMVAAAKVVKIGHSISSEYRIGCMIAGMFSYPFTCDPKDQIENQKVKQDNFYLFADTMMRGAYPSYAKRVMKEDGVTLNVSDEDKQTLLEGKADFFAYSYYCSSCVTTHKDESQNGKGNLSAGLKNPYLEVSKWGWAIDPDGLKFSLHELYDRYQKPLLIVENGFGAIDKLEDDGTIHDPYRIEYHKAHIEKMKEAVEEGVDLFGYTMWSCIDLVSFSSGEMRKRYGFIYVDIDDEGKGTFKRYKKDSFYYYQKVCQSNGEEI